MTTTDYEPRDPDRHEVPAAFINIHSDAPAEMQRVAQRLAPIGDMLAVGATSFGTAALEGTLAALDPGGDAKRTAVGLAQVAWIDPVAMVFRLWVAGGKDRLDGGRLVALIDTMPLSENMQAPPLLAAKGVFEELAHPRLDEAVLADTVARAAAATVEEMWSRLRELDPLVDPADIPAVNQPSLAWYLANHGRTLRTGRRFR